MVGYGTVTDPVSKCRQSLKTIPRGSMMQSSWLPGACLLAFATHHLNLAYGKVLHWTEVTY